MTLIDGYHDGEFVKEHPLGPIQRVFKDEYHIHFEKCVIQGQISKEQFHDLRKLKYNSYIVEYESCQDQVIVLENIKCLPKTMSLYEVYKMLIDMFHAVEVLQENQLSTEMITIDRIYQTQHHYKLDCYPISYRDYPLLIQDICQIGLQIIPHKSKQLYYLFVLYSNIKYQDSIKQMIRNLENITIEDEKCNLCQMNLQDYRKNAFITKYLPLYLIKNYASIILVVIVVVIILLI
ncbi:MAG: hypothetical protein ACLUVC_09150 [Longibaculum sp.]